MSNAASTLSRDDSSRVDSALRNWRTETVTRRRSWDADQAILEQQQLQRRQRLRGIAAASAGVFTLALVVGMGLTTALSSGQADIAASSAAPIPMIGEVTEYLTPTKRVTPVAAGQDLGLLGEVRTWRHNAGLWIQFDYSGAPLVLKWSDSTGAEVMEPTPCVNAVGAGVRRCYVGRTARRIDLAKQAGAQPGTWTASACRGEVCRTVATYLVD